MEFEDILFKVGGFERFQRNFVLFFLLPVACITPFYWMNLFFYVSIPQHWCYVQELANLTIDQQKHLIRPPSDPSCSMYNLNDKAWQGIEKFAVPNDTETIPCTNGWQYDKDNYDATAASKWNMVCDQHHLPGLLLSLSRVGSLICTPVYGFISDRYGRKIVFLVLAIVVTSSELASVLVSDVVSFTFLRTIQGSVMPSMSVIPFILTLELVTPNVRGNINGVFNCCCTFGFCLLPLVAYLSRNWVNLGYISSVAGFLFICFWRFIPESPCWLISKGRYEDALEILIKVGKKNKKCPNREEIMLQLKVLGESIENKKKLELRTPRSIFLKFPRLRKHCLIIYFCWTAFVVSYVGLTYNLINLDGNEFLNFFYLTVVEFPGNLVFWFLMNRVGRRWTVTFGFLFTGITCLIPVSGLNYSEIVSSLFGKFFMTGIYMVIEQQSSEIFPTVARSFCIGAVKTASTATTLFLPYIAYLSEYGKSLPFVVISLTCFAAGVMSSFLPETLNENLPQTISDAENIGKDQKYFSFNRRKQTIESECQSTKVPVEIET